jgi:hypothetical protein
LTRSSSTRNTIPTSPVRTVLYSIPPNPYMLISTLSLSLSVDVVIMRQGIKLARQVGAAFGALLGAESAPGAGVQADADIEAWLVQGGAGTQYHPAATCAMLPEAQGGVVGPDLRVYGLGECRGFFPLGCADGDGWLAIGNVRVADASVFPFEFAAHVRGLLCIMLQLPLTSAHVARLRHLRRRGTSCGPHQSLHVHRPILARRPFRDLVPYHDIKCTPFTKLFILYLYVIHDHFMPPPVRSIVF